MLRTLRPVGNRVKYSPHPFDDGALKPYQFIGFESGTAALAFALVMVKSSRAGISNPEVLLPAYTCPDLISACLFANIKPVLVDFEADTPWMDIEQLKQKINSSTIAIIAINFLGIPERMPLLSSLKEKHDFEIIEDSAQGFPRNSPGNYWSADLVITSFGRGKPLNLLSGGALLIRNNKYQSLLLENSVIDDTEKTLFDGALYRLKITLFNILSRPTFYYFLSRVSFLKIGKTIFKPLTSIKTLSKTILEQFSSNYSRYQLRQQPIERYKSLFNSFKSDEIINLAQVCCLDNDQPLLRLPILIKNKQLAITLFEELTKSDLGVSQMYEKTLPQIQGVDKSLFADDEIFPNAEKFSQQLITLPTHEDVTDRNLKKIETIFKKHLNEGNS